jgi:hypothetical protein
VPGVVAETVPQSLPLTVPRLTPALSPLLLIPLPPPQAAMVSSTHVGANRRTGLAKVGAIMRARDRRTELGGCP